VFGSLVPVRDDLGLELSVSKSNNSKPTLGENVATLSRVLAVSHPFLNCTEAANVTSEGGLAHNSEKMRAALIWMRTHPWKFLKLSLLRFTYFWFTPYSPRFKAIDLGIMTIMGIVAGTLLFQREEPAAILFFVVWMIYPLTFYFIRAAPRYGYPIDCTFLLLAIYFISEAIEYRARRASVDYLPEQCRAI